MLISIVEIYTELDRLHLCAKDLNTPSILAQHFIITKSLYSHPFSDVIAKDFIRYIRGVFGIRDGISVDGLH